MTISYSVYAMETGEQVILYVIYGRKLYFHMMKYSELSWSTVFIIQTVEQVSSFLIYRRKSCFHMMKYR